MLLLNYDVPALADPVFVTFEGSFVLKTKCTHNSIHICTLILCMIDVFIDVHISWAYSWENCL